MKAVLFGLRSLAKYLKLIHIKVLRDNSTAVACINKFGTSKSFECDSLTQEIWVCAANVSILPSAVHIPWVQDFEVDLESRKQELYTEWKLKDSDFQFLRRKLDFSPNIDLFIIRINTNLPILLPVDLTQTALQSIYFFWIGLKWTFMHSPICMSDESLPKNLP